MVDANDPPLDADKLEEYRGSKNWEGLIPDVDESRTWDEGFRAFLLKYGMMNHIVYDVYIKNTGDGKDEDGLSGTSRFGTDFERFTKKGLQFNYLNRDRERKVEYDFTEEYHVIGNMVCSPRSFYMGEDNWFGFIMLSNDLKELVIVFRGTQTIREWVENATCTLAQLDGEPDESGCALFWNRQVEMATVVHACEMWYPNALRENFMVHVGFQSIYIMESYSGCESPKATVHRLIEEHKSTIEKVTVVGHSLGGALCQLCAVDIARSKVLGDVPILCIAWGAPKIGNRFVAKWVESQHPRLRNLRIRGANDVVAMLPPNWLFNFINGGYQHFGTEIILSNEHLRKGGLVMDEGLGPNHNLEMYLYNIDPTRDLALLNKVGSCIPEEYCAKHNISPSWHSLTWPRTIFE